MTLTLTNSTPVLANPTPSNLDRFTQRAMTGVEGNLYGISYEIGQGRAAVATALGVHDARHDRLLDAAVGAIDDGLKRLPIDRQTRLFLRGVRRLIVLAQEADALEDAEIVVADSRMAAAHDEAKAGAGAIESLLVDRARE